MSNPQNRGLEFFERPVNEPKSALAVWYLTTKREEAVPGCRF